MSNGTVIATILAIIGIVTIGCLVFKHPEKPKQTIPLREGPIVAFGDSLIFGYGATQNGGFVSMLSQEIGKPIINLGVNGNTTQDGIVRLNTVLAKKPSVVLLLLGGNDFLKQLPQEQTFANLDNIIQQLQANGIRVVLLGIQGGILSDPYAKPFEVLAKKYSLEYVPNVLDGIITDKSLMFDAVHPNDAGYKKIADKVLPVLKETLGL